MCTILISKVGGFTAHIDEIFLPKWECYFYKVDETSFSSISQKKAIRNARSFLKKQRKLLKAGKIKPYTPKVKRYRTKPVKVKRTRKNPVK
jgi:hypothetical protein